MLFIAAVAGQANKVDVWLKRKLLVSSSLFCFVPETISSRNTAIFDWSHNWCDRTSHLFI